MGLEEKLVVEGHESGSDASLPVEQYFLRYAFPCAHILLDRGKISDDEYQRLRRAAVTGDDLPSVNELASIFTAAADRLRVVAQKLGLDVWDRRVVEAYFKQYHNNIIDEGDGMYARASQLFCELCKVKELPVLEKKIVDGTVWLRVRDRAVRDGYRWVESPYFSNVSVNDVVTVHQSIAVEKAPYRQ